MRTLEGALDFRSGEQRQTDTREGVEAEPDIGLQELIDKLEEIEQSQDHLMARNEERTIGSTRLAVGSVFKTLTSDEEDYMKWELRALENSISVLQQTLSKQRQGCITLAERLAGENQKLLEKQEAAAATTQDTMTQIQQVQTRLVAQLQA